MRRTLLTRRWLSFALLVVLLVTLFLFLARWQWHRHEWRRAANAEQSHGTSAAPVPVDDVLSADRRPAPSAKWRHVRVTGHYDADHQVLWRQRPRDGQPGFEVLTPLLRDGRTAVLVDRGWVAAAGDARATPHVPDPASGQVTVVGYALPPSKDRTTAGLPAGQVTGADTVRLSRDTGYPLLQGYVQLARQTPSTGDAPEPLDLPELDAGPHLAYAVQWCLFAVIAVVGFFVLARQEARGGPERLPAAPRPAVSADSRPTVSRPAVSADSRPTGSGGPEVRTPGGPDRSSTARGA